MRANDVVKSVATERKFGTMRREKVRAMRSEVPGLCGIAERESSLIGR